MNSPTYQPKGSMCMACQKRQNNCANLHFAAMPVLKRDANVTIVKCLQFVKAYAPVPGPAISVNVNSKGRLS